jgi:hypothetical protein
MSKKNWNKLFNKKSRTHKNSFNFNNKQLDDIVDFGDKAYKFDGKRWKESKEDDEQELEMSDSYTVNNSDSFASSKALHDLNAKVASDLTSIYTKGQTDAKIVALSPPATKAHVDGLAVNAGTLDGLDSSQFLRSDADDTTLNALRIGGSKLMNGGGSLEIAPMSTGTGYNNSAIEIRESNFTSNDTATPPHIGFHWGGVVASNIAIESDGTITIRNNPGNSYENFKANKITAMGGFVGDGSALTGVSGSITRSDANAAGEGPAGAGDGDMWFDTSGDQGLNVWQNGTDGWAWYPLNSESSKKHQFSTALGAHGYGEATSWRSTSDKVNITTDAISAGVNSAAERWYGAQGLSHNYDKAYAFGGNRANTTVWNLASNTTAELSQSTGSRAGAFSSDRHDYSVVANAAGRGDKFLHATQTQTTSFFGNGSTELGSFSDMNDTGFWAVGNNNFTQWNFATGANVNTDINTSQTSLDQAGTCEYQTEAIIQVAGNSNDDVHRFNLITRVSTHVADSSHHTGEATAAGVNGPSGYATYFVGGYSTGQGGAHGQNQYVEKYINSTGTKTQVGVCRCDRSSGVGAGY